MSGAVTQPQTPGRDVHLYSAPREWTRLHPVTPVLKGWPWAVAVGAWWFYTAGPWWLGGGASDIPDEVVSRISLNVLGYIGIALGVAVLATVIATFMWRVNVYRVTDTAVEHNKGLVFRVQTQARLDRLQAVDVVQPLVARIFGFAKIKIEVAGGENSSVALEFLRLGDAEALRNEIIALAAGYKAEVAAMRADAGLAATSSPAPAPGEKPRSTGPGLSPQDINILGSRPYATAIGAAAETEVFKVPLPRLIGSVLRSGATIFLGLFILGAVVFAIIGASSKDIGEVLLSITGASAAGVIGALVSTVAIAFKALNAAFNFRAAVSADGIRLSHGLFETTRQTVPPGRVQALVFRQPLLWRGKDWWSARINVAGYQTEAGQMQATQLLPVGPSDEALRALFLALPDVGDPDPQSVVGLAMRGTGADGGFIPSPRRARWLDPWQWKRRGVKATETALLIRQGRFTRQLFVVPHERTQELKLYQGPIQRWLGLASLHVKSVQGPVVPVAHHLAIEDAVRLLDEQAERARQRRKVQTPEQWARKVGAIVDVPAADATPEAVETVADAPAAEAADAPAAEAPAPEDGS